MIKSYNLTLTKEELRVIQTILEFGLAASVESDIHQGGYYQLNDSSLVSVEQLEQIIYEMPIFKKSYVLEDGVSLELEVALDPDVVFPYINPSLYINGELAMHHTALHELNELMEGISFDLSNENHIFKVTSIGQSWLSQQAYHICFEKE